MNAIRVIGLLCMGAGAILFLWQRHGQNEQNRDQVIEHDGHDVEMGAIPFLRRDGRADLNPDVDGDEFDLGAQPAHDDWIDQTEPRG